LKWTRHSAGNQIRRDVHRIRVAVKDPTSKSLPAVVKAAQLARARGAELELFHGMATTPYTNLFTPQNAELAEVELETRAEAHCRAPAQAEHDSDRICKALFSGERGDRAARAPR
jgi:hypothetical protein